MDYVCITKILNVSTFILSKVRYSPEEKSTRDILSFLSELYAEDLSLWDYENIVNHIASLNLLKNSMDSLNVILSANNTITDNIAEIKKYSILISKLCKTGCSLYSELRFEQLSDLVDLMHGLPEALIVNNMWNPKLFWKTYFNPYCKKWDKNFMLNEQKILLSD